MIVVPGSALRQLGEVQERVQRRVTAPDDRHAPPGIAVAMHPQHVGNPVEQAVMYRGLSPGGRAVGAQGVR